MVYLPGGGSNIAYIYATDGTLKTQITLPEEVRSYTCTAYDPENREAYVIFGGSGNLYSFLISSNGKLTYSKVALSPASPTAYPIGLDFGDNYLWIIGRGGGIHRIDPYTGIVEALSIQPPYYPLSEGDRLVYVNTTGTAYLYHVREDGTSEVWKIRVS